MLPKTSDPRVHSGLFLGFAGVLMSLLVARVVAIRADGQDTDVSQINWPQWGQNPQHQGFVQTLGQAATSVLADTVYDPFTAAEERDTGGDLLVHYQVPLVDGDDVFMEFKAGTFIECSPPGSGNPPPRPDRLRPIRLELPDLEPKAAALGERQPGREVGVPQ